MFRMLPAFVAGFLFLTVGAARAADAPAGTWKMAIPGSNLTFLFTLENKDGKWAGQFLGTNVPDFAKVTMSDIAVAADTVRMTFKIAKDELSFEGRLPPDPKTGKIAGSLAAGRVILVHLEPSKLKTFDRFEFGRETIEQSDDSRVLTDAAVDVLKQAWERKTKLEDVRGWADKTYRSADPYGPRWQRTVATRLAQAMAGQKDYADLAVEYARKAERLLDEGDDIGVQMDTLEALALVLTQAGKADVAKDYQARLAKLEEKDLADYAKKGPFKPDAFEGRKGKSDRAVLVELFTGGECQPCVAAEVGFDGLSKTYKPAEVILLQYHYHFAGGDPLANPDVHGRFQFYQKKLENTPPPPMFFNGKLGAGGGGALAAAKKKYTDFRAIIDPLLEKPAEAKIALTATRKGDEINIKANVADVARTGDGIRLRLVLVEENVRYLGGNGLRYHHCVVRSFPGGVKGTALTKKTAEQSATVKLGELRTKLGEYLDDMEARMENGFPKPERPMSMQKLRVIAFIQDDESNEILQAVQVEVKE